MARKGQASCMCATLPPPPPPHGGALLVNSASEQARWSTELQWQVFMLTASTSDIIAHQHRLWWAPFLPPIYAVAKCQLHARPGPGQLHPFNSSDVLRCPLVE